MKGFLRWLLGVAAIFAVGGFGLYHFRATTAKQTYQLKLSELSQGFDRNMAGLFELPSEHYTDEMSLLLSRYFRDLRKLSSQFPGHFDPDRELTYGEEEHARGRLTAAQKAARDERINLAQTVFESMASGSYRPLFSQADKRLRFDVLDFKPQEVDGVPVVRMRFVQWGAYGPVSYRSIVGTMRPAPNADKEIKIPQIVAQNQAPSLIFEANRWVREFPPGAQIGYYDLPRFPHMAESIQLNFTLALRSIGGTETNAHIALPNLPIKAAWKLKEGESWRGTERYASDQELRAAGADI